MMFDANARHLKKGTMFFAVKGGDLLYCEMLDAEHKNPRIKIITSYLDNKGYKGHIYQRQRHDKWGFAWFSGYVNNGELESFIDNDEATKAALILERIKQPTLTRQ